MNIAVHPAPDLPPRRAFNVEDIRRMLDAGVIREEERFELIEGEIVVMSPKSVAHDDVQNALNLALARAVPEGLYVGNGSTLQLAEDVLVEPDHAIISQGSLQDRSSGLCPANRQRCIACDRNSCIEPDIRPQNKSPSLRSARHPRVLGYRCEWAGLDSYASHARGLVVDRGARTQRRIDDAGCARLFGPAERHRMTMNAPVIDPAPDLPPRRAFNVDDIREGWSSVVKRIASEPLTMPALPRLAIRLSDIGT